MVNATESDEIEIFVLTFYYIFHFYLMIYELAIGLA